MNKDNVRWQTGAAQYVRLSSLTALDNRRTRPAASPQSDRPGMNIPPALCLNADHVLWHTPSDEGRGGRLETLRVFVCGRIPVPVLERDVRDRIAVRLESLTYVTLGRATRLELGAGQKY